MKHRHVRKNIPWKLHKELWDWCCLSFECEEWSATIGLNNDTFSMSFYRERDYIWFILKWEDTIQNYLNNTVIIDGGNPGFRVGDLICIKGSRNGTIKRIINISGDRLKVENA